MIRACECASLAFLQALLRKAARPEPGVGSLFCSTAVLFLDKISARAMVIQCTSSAMRKIIRKFHFSFRSSDTEVCIHQNFSLRGLFHS